MSSFATLLVLLGAGFMILECEAALWQYNNKPDPIDELNNYLIKTEESRNFNKVIAALRMANSSVEDDVKLVGEKPFKLISKLSHEARDLAGLVSRLAPIERSEEESCSGLNLKNLRDTIDYILRYNADSFDEEFISSKSLFKRKKNFKLNNLLKRYTAEARDKCLEILHDSFPKSAEDEYEVKLKDQDKIYYYNPKFNSFEFVHFIRANKIRSGQFGGEGLLQFMPITYDSQLQNRQGIRSNVGRAIVRGTEKAKIKFLEERLIEPCKLFLQDKPVQDILGVAVDLGVAIWKTNVSTDLQGNDKLLLWASRSLICNWALEQGAGRLHNLNEIRIKRAEAL